MIQYNDLVLSGSLNVKDGITGSLAGTASFALTASYSLNSETIRWTDRHIPYASGSTLTGSNALRYNYRRATLFVGSDIVDGEPFSQAAPASIVAGNGTAVLAPWTFAAGNQARAFNTGSVAFGYRNDVGGDYSLLHGYANELSGQGAHGEGVNTKTYGDYAHAEGWATLAEGIASHAEGYFTSASAIYSHAEGDNTKALGNHAHSEGNNTIAQGQGSHAEGTFTLASGSYSHAEGYFTEAKGERSHAEGFYTTALGDNSHAQGAYTTASGQYSLAAGFFTNATANGQTVVGRYNATSSNGLFIIGAGVNATSRRNVVEVAADYITLTSPVTASIISSSLTGTASFAAYASESFNAALFDRHDAAFFINTGSTGTTQDITGSVTITQNLTVLGQSTFVTITASRVILDQNTISVFGSGSALPVAGFIAADTASIYASGSLLFNLPDQIWYANAPISTSRVYATASYADKYPTREHVFTPATASWICNHNLGTRWVQVTCWDSTTNMVIQPDEIEALSTASVKITFTTPIQGVARIS